MEDPDYAKALYRKVLILEKKGDYQFAYNIVSFAIQRFDDDFEEEANKQVVPLLKEI